MTSQPTSPKADKEAFAALADHTAHITDIAERFLLAEARKAVHDLTEHLQPKIAEELAQNAVHAVLNFPDAVSDPDFDFTGRYGNSCSNDKFRDILNRTWAGMRGSDITFEFVEATAAEIVENFPYDYTKARSYINEHDGLVSKKATGAVRDILAAGLVQAAHPKVPVKTPVMLNFYVASGVLTDKAASELASGFRAVLNVDDEPEKSEATAGGKAETLYNLALQSVQYWADKDPNFEYDPQAHVMLPHVVIFAESVMDQDPDADFAGAHKFPAGQAPSNELVKDMANGYRKLKAEASEASGDDGPLTERFEQLKDDFGTDAYVVSLAFDVPEHIACDKNGRWNFPVSGLKTVRRQEAFVELPVMYAHDAAVFVSTPDANRFARGKVVIVSKEMIGNDKITAGTVFDMIKDGRVSVAAWNEIMKAGFVALNSVRKKAETEADARFGGNMLQAPVIGDKHPE